MSLCFTRIYKWEGDSSVYQSLLFKSKKDRKAYENRCDAKTGLADSLEMINDWDHEGFENNSGALYKFRAVRINVGMNESPLWKGVIRNGKNGNLCLETGNRVFSSPKETINYLKNLSINYLIQKESKNG